MTKRAFPIVILCCLLLLIGTRGLAQAPEAITAANLARLQPAARIDFAGLPGEYKSGFFAANADASTFLVADKQGRLTEITEAGFQRSLPYRNPRDGQIFSLIDALYLDEMPIALYALDNNFYLNEQRLALDAMPAALFALPASGNLLIEAVTADGGLIAYEYARLPGADGWARLAAAAFPALEAALPRVRIGRIPLPLLLLSALEDNILTMYRYPRAFRPESARNFPLERGPAVAGAVNAAGSHLAWSAPGAPALQLLDLGTGENVLVAETGGAYAQYHLLSHDASAIFLINLDFAPIVAAWEVATGQRHELGRYRACGRIPDKVALSADGRALIIGCDSGLEIWRVMPEKEK